MPSTSIDKNWSLFDQLICFMCCFLLLIDSINGFLLNTYTALPLTLSQSYKLLLIVLMLSRIFVLSFLSSLYFLLLLSVLSITITYNALIADSLTGILTDGIAVSKLLAMPIAFLYFRKLVQNRPHFTSIIFQSFITINFFVLGVNLVLGQFGFGYVQYEYSSIGTSGFFYAGNEVSVVLIIVACFVLYHLWMNKASYYIPFALLCLYFAILLATKAAILGILLTMALIPFFAERYQIFTITKQKLNLASFITLFAPAIMAITIYGVIETGLMERMLYNYQIKDDFIGFILSSRDTMVNTGMRVLSQSYNIFEIFIGVGKARFTELATLSHNKTLASVEIDFLDLFFYFGITGLIVILSFWLFLLVQSVVKTLCYGNYYAPIVLLMNILLLLISFTAGHVMFSGMATIFIGFANAMTFYSLSEPARIQNKSNEQESN